MSMLTFLQSLKDIRQPEVMSNPDAFTRAAQIAGASWLALSIPDRETLLHNNPVAAVWLAGYTVGLATVFPDQPQDAPVTASEARTAPPAAADVKDDLHDPTHAQERQEDSTP